MNRLRAKDVDAYLSMVPRDKRAVLEKLRKSIQAAAPHAEEVISYGIPGYRYRGTLVFFAAFKNHCSLFAAGRSILEAFKDELKRYDISGTTIHFTPGNPLPATLVRKIVKARIVENELRAEQKKKRSREMANQPVRGTIKGNPAIVRKSSKNKK
ncbi:MAG: DUF1801 domain-containing protein [Bacteroidota bacterium]